VAGRAIFMPVFRDFKGLRHLFQDTAPAHAFWAYLADFGTQKN